MAIPKGKGKVWETPVIGQRYEPYFRLAESHYQLPAGILSRMAKQESNYNPDARGTSGEIGIMQIIPKWHPNVDASNPAASIDYAGRALKSYYNEFRDWRAAIAAYNWGITNVRTKGLAAAPASTVKYYTDILTDIGVM